MSDISLWYKLETRVDVPEELVNLGGLSHAADGALIRGSSVIFLDLS